MPNRKSRHGAEARALRELSEAQVLEQVRCQRLSLEGLEPTPHEAFDAEVSRLLDLVLGQEEEPR